ncbi:MAG: tetratricopeptide (TPR) repeat protein/outer membrane receptor protein involved in Fe transport [Verrucomicrobiales bacterium]
MSSRPAAAASPADNIKHQELAPADCKLAGLTPLRIAHGNPLRLVGTTQPRSSSRFGFALLILLLTVSFIPTSRAAAPAPASTEVAALLSVAGTVEYLAKGTSKWVAAKVGQELLPGDTLRTGVNSRASIRTANRMRKRLLSSTTVLISKGKSGGGGTISTPSQGSMYFQSREKPKNKRFTGPRVSGAILGTEFYLTVDEDGSTRLALLDGLVELENEHGKIQLGPDEEAIVLPNQPPTKRAVVDAAAAIQWALYYPAVVDIADLQLSESDTGAIRASLDAYRAGDLLGALAAYPVGRSPTADAERSFRAELLLSVGETDKARKLLTSPPVNTPGARAVISLINTILGATGKAEAAASPDSASELLAASYRDQANFDLKTALNNARLATDRSPQFGFAWARVAELEFSFGLIGKATTALNKALELSPHNAQAVALQGFLLSANGKYASAAKAFQRAIDLDGSLPTGWLGLGLTRIARGDTEAGREDLQTASMLDPRRAIIRSYLGKAFSHEGDNGAAMKELTLSRRIDPNDPTSFLYSALIHQQENRINQAVRDLEKSLELNENRGLYRSGLLLDQDRAVRSANLALIYRDAGMTEVSIVEAYKAMQNDPANYASHLFLANSLNERRGLQGVDLRFETPAVTEYLTASLLAPPGAGMLSQSITSQEYSRFFTGKQFGVTSQTDYSSDGRWLNVNAVSGDTPNVSYAIGSFYQNESGTRPNNDVEALSLNIQTKLFLTPRDSVFLQAIYADIDAGDRSQRYDPTTGAATIRLEERQEPIILAGYHHEWAPGSRTLFLAGWLNDTFEVRDPVNAPIVFPGVPITADLRYQSDLQAYTAELQQIWQTDRRSFTVGVRGQNGSFETTTTQANPTGLPMPPFAAGTFNAQSIENDFYRLSVYGYHTWQAVEPLTLTAGLSYDHIHFPQNFRNPPINGAEEGRTKLSPKAGVLWTPHRNTAVRFAYTRSLGGVSIDQSFRLEPTQVAGINQAFRSLIPESLTGGLTAPAFETWGVAVDQKFGTGTYLGVAGEILKSDAKNTVGAYVAGFAGGTLNPVDLTQDLTFEEKALSFYANQLLSDHWSIGAKYRVSLDDLNRQTRQTGLNEDFQATLQEADFFVRYNHPCGFFARAESVWRHQGNAGFAPAQPGDQFWQHNLIAGYRFPRRRAEIQLGVLNLADAGYNLSPITPYRELPRERVFAGRLRFNF